LARETPAMRGATNRSDATLPNFEPPPNLRSPREAPPAGFSGDRCPAPGVGRTPREGGYLFGVVALAEVDAALEVKSAVELLAEAVGEACGQEAAVGQGLSAPSPR